MLLRSNLVQLPYVTREETEAREFTWLVKGPTACQWQNENSLQSQYRAISITLSNFDSLDIPFRSGNMITLSK